MTHCRRDDGLAMHTRCMSSRIPSIGAVCFAVLMTGILVGPSPARADGWTLPGSQSEWGSFALGVISGLGVHELGHFVVARAKGYSTSLDGLSIVYPDEDLAGADQLQVASAGFQAQWLMTEIALRDSQGRALKTPPGNFAAGVVCAHLGISLAYLTFLKNHKQGDVYGMSEATGYSRTRIAAVLAIPAALDAWRLFGNDVPEWVPQVSLLGKGLGMAWAWTY
jgi:hypothetical protein